MLSMSILDKIFRRKAEPDSTGGIEDFMLLIRVYYQSVMAAQLGINNLGALPDLRIFKQTYHVPTVNNKLGIGERKKCRQLIQDIYHISDGFFAEIDASIKKKCRKMQDAQTYFITFQGFSQELMMLMGNLMQWKFRLPSFFHKALRQMVEKQINTIMTGNSWKDDAVRRSCLAVRKYQATLGYSQEWMTEYVHTVVMLAKKEPRKKSED